ncbi:MAG: hypothetical protein GM45_2800 [actinobacterium acAMD-5]|jgi:hypothetical protein|nr:MAG: hypothetical protein GM45_2800 [actinobacterium acAMD-5]
MSALEDFHYQELTERDQRILEFEREWWRFAGAKESAIRELFGIEPAYYYQQLNELIDQPAAEAHEPLLVRRLRRQRGTRQTGRSSGSVA